MMKKRFAFVLALAMVLSLASCGGSGATAPTANDAETETETVELTVFAAASMTETLTQIAELYKAEAPDVTLSFNFDSSGTLKTQIEEGATCDLFISAAQKQMNALDAEDTTGTNEGLDFILSESRVDLLENKVVLIVSGDSTVSSFEDMAQKLKDNSILMAMGNEDVPVGQYTQKILDYYDLDETELANAGCITYGSNVKEVLTQVAEQSVDCGVVYCTDAFSAGDVVSIVDYATAEMCGQVIYPAAVLKESQHQDEAQAFLEFLSTDPCAEIFETVGFTAIK